MDGLLALLTRLRFTAGLAKVRVTVVWIRAGGTSVGRLPCAFDLYTQLTSSRYNEKRTDPMVRPTIVDKSLATLLYFLGCFLVHTGPTPPLTPQTMLDACIQNFF